MIESANMRGIENPFIPINTLNMKIPNLKDRYTGAMLGLACGDAVGTSVEFEPRGTFPPVVDMTGGGPFGLEPGQWTDDTSMALCLAESLVEKGEFDPEDQMNRYLAWWQRGYLSSTGDCFDIGVTVRGALARFRMSGDPYSGSTDPYSAGNGSLMRLVPVVLFAFPDTRVANELAAASSCTTHGAPEAVESCQLFAEIVCAALNGLPKNELLAAVRFKPTQSKIAALAAGSFVSKQYTGIRGSGYCVESLEAALWCFFHTDDFEQAVLAAVNLGDDADTTGAIVGQLAGSYYGATAIPEKWRSRITMAERIAKLADRLHERTKRIAP